MWHGRNRPRLPEGCLLFRSRTEERVQRGCTKGDALLEPFTVGPNESEDAAEFARSVQIVSPLPDHFRIRNWQFRRLSAGGGTPLDHNFLRSIQIEAV